MAYMPCDWYGCTRHPEGTSKYCLFHKKMAGEPKEVKPVKSIEKQSENIKEVNKQLKKIYPVYLKLHPACNIKSPVCLKKATCVNHTRGRGANVLNQEDWEPSCIPCNGYIESHHAWAAERGHKKEQHTKQ
jgi:hypothetical protein